MQKTILKVIILLLLTSCSIKPKGTFGESQKPMAPNYDDLYYWAAHPDKADAADLVPPPLQDSLVPAQVVDVFFLYPTIYTGKKGDKGWNAPVDDPDFNERVDSSAIKFQASIFNEMGRVYAPRYRQAHLHAYHSKKRASAEKAFELAYADVKAAFEYYLEHERKPGTPIIIAGHSQGTTHAKQLLKDYFDGTDLLDYLVAAYIPGIAVKFEEFENIPVCNRPDQIRCFCSWRTWKEGKEPKNWTSPEVAVTNPINWKIDTSFASNKLHNGAILPNFEDYRPAFADARVNHELGILWTSRPKIFGSFFLFGNYHIADFNLFYRDVQLNVRERVDAYMEAELWNY
ncbi:MAG: DUF3089 domain-containing protein [Bacteroidetes bacterium]|nr:DUF3089 domain-containing protein [Bacteroidota bacterium]